MNAGCPEWLAGGSLLQGLPPSFSTLPAATHSGSAEAGRAVLVRNGCLALLLSTLLCTTTKYSKPMLFYPYPHCEANPKGRLVQTQRPHHYELYRTLILVSLLCFSWDHHSPPKIAPNAPAIHAQTVRRYAQSLLLRHWCARTIPPNTGVSQLHLQGRDTGRQGPVL